MRLIEECDRCSTEYNCEYANGHGRLQVPGQKDDKWTLATLRLCPACVERALEKPASRPEELKRVLDSEHGSSPQAD